jgi:hypothetical protein
LKNDAGMHKTRSDVFLLFPCHPQLPLDHNATEETQEVADVNEQTLILGWFVNAVCDYPKPSGPQHSAEVGGTNFRVYDDQAVLLPRGVEYRLNGARLQKVVIRKKPAIFPFRQFHRAVTIAIEPCGGCGWRIQASALKVFANIAKGSEAPLKVSDYLLRVVCRPAVHHKYFHLISSL